MSYRYNNEEGAINLVNFARNLVSIPVFVKSSSKKLEQVKPPKKWLMKLWNNVVELLVPSVICLPTINQLYKISQGLL